MGSAFGIIAAYVLEKRVEREQALKMEVLLVDGREGVEVKLQDSGLKWVYTKYVPSLLREQIPSFINLLIVIAIGMAILKVDDTENNFTECFYFAVITGTTIGEKINNLEFMDSVVNK